MVKYAEHELFSITTFTKQISSLLKSIKDNSLEKIGILKNNRLEVVVVSTEEYSRLKKIEQDAQASKWSYWRDEELDNFGKIAIGLSRHDYDNEDYSKW
jgi:PHD/YefM family antitoxin component YafN of YafNO toxin-antitoxin module